jgi:hypothetical protein
LINRELELDTRPRFEGVTPKFADYLDVTLTVSDELHVEYPLLEMQAD